VFASSLCANSAKAVVVTIGLMAAGVGLAAATISGIIRILQIRPTPGDLVSLASALLIVYFSGLIALTQYLAYRNHRADAPDNRRFWAQLATVIFAIVAGAALGFVWCN
jgi:hypothetical protein